MARELLNCGGLAVSRTTHTSRREDNGTCVVERWLFHVPLTSPRQRILSKKIIVGCSSRVVGAAIHKFPSCFVLVGQLLHVRC